jgi:hypothetical protein
MSGGKQEAPESSVLGLKAQRYLLGLSGTCLEMARTGNPDVLRLGLEVLQRAHTELQQLGCAQVVSVS